MEVVLKLPEFAPSKEIIFTMAVDKEERQRRSYELIIGRDFMKALEMDIRTLLTAWLYVCLRAEGSGGSAPLLCGTT